MNVARYKITPAVRDEIGRMAPNITDEKIKTKVCSSIEKVLAYLEEINQDDLSNKLILTIYNMYPLLETNDLEEAIDTVEDVYIHLVRKAFVSCSECGRAFVPKRKRKEGAKNYCPACSLERRKRRQLRSNTLS